MSPLLADNSYTNIKEMEDYIPENYIASTVRTIRTAQAIDPAEIFRYPRRYPPTPIWRLLGETKNYKTPKPISVIIYQDEELFFAENENLVVCGTGETPRAALEDLCTHIIHFYNYYKGVDRDKLMGDALRLKALYDNLLVED